MKYLQDDDGNTLQLPDGLLLYKRTISFLTWAVQGDYSADFTAPNDSEVRKTLGFRSLNQLNRPTQKAFGFYVDGNRISVGKVFIRSVEDEFDLFFVAGNSNWMNDIQGNVSDIDFSDFDITFTAANVVASWSNTEGLIFPVMDWAYNYKKLSTTFLAKTITGVRVDGFYDFYPVIYAHTILFRILETYGIKIGGNLVDDPIYKTIGLTPPQINSSAYLAQFSAENLESMSNSDFQQPDVTVKVPMTQGTTLFNNANDRLLFTDDSGPGVVLFSLQKSNDDNPNDWTLQLRKNGATVASVTTDGETLSMSGSYNDPDILAADYFELWTVTAFNGITVSSASVSISFTSTISGNRASASSALPSIGQFDFIKYIAQRFNCLVTFDELTRTLNFTMLDYIRRQDAVDLSQALQSAKIIPLSGYAERNFVRVTPAEELGAYTAEGVNFGDDVLSGDGDGDQEVFQTPFRGAETFNNQNLGWLLTNVPLVRLEDADEGGPFTTVMDNATGSTGFSGKAEFVYGFNDFLGYTVGSIVRVEGTLYNGFTFVLQVDSIGITLDVPFTATDTGKIVRQKIVFNPAGSREVIITRDVTLLSLGTDALDEIIVEDDATSEAEGTVAWAYFAKPNIGTALDNFRVGLNYGPVQNVGNISFGDYRHKVLHKIVQGGKVDLTFLLSEVQFNNLSAGQFIFVETVDFSGYFLIDDIGGFQDSVTPVVITSILVNG